MGNNLILNPGNIVYTKLYFGCPNYGAIILPVDRIEGEGARFSVPYDDSNTWEPLVMSFEHISGLELSFIPLFDLFGISMPSGVPPHIKYFHDLQNWHQFVRGKSLIDFDTFDDRDGAVWIEISKEYRTFCGIDEKELYTLRNP